MFPLIEGALAIWPIINKLLKGRGIITDPEEEKKYQLDLIEMAQKEEQFFAQSLTAVNTTMQAEAKSEHWAQWLWRPVVGFTFAAMIINNYVLMPYFQTYIHPIVIPSEVWNAMLMVLGVSAATRGWQKIELVRNGNGKNGANGDAKANASNPASPLGANLARPTAPLAPSTPLEGRPMVDHPAVNRDVGGSSPPPPAKPHQPAETEDERHTRIEAGREFLRDFGGIER